MNIVRSCAWLTVAFVTLPYWCLWPITGLSLLGALCALGHDRAE